jgi:hypothetical protein
MFDKFQKQIASLEIRILKGKESSKDKNGKNQQ